MVSESYEIEGDKGVFTSVSDILNGKPITFEVMVNEIEEDKYEFKINDSFVFSPETLETIIYTLRVSGICQIRSEEQIPVSE